MRRPKRASPAASARANAPPASSGGLHRGLVLACFLVSGGTALAYEVVWVKMLTLVFGTTVLSVGSVLASYMAGLALGSSYWSRRADRTTRPLRLYALLEFSIALSALLTPLLFQAIQTLYKALFVGGFSDFSLLSVARFLLCLPALLLPTFLMGGTLPVLARFYTSSLARIGRGAGDLYGVNTFGAVLGTLLAGFALVPALGVKGTLVGAAAVNALVALVAYLLSRMAPRLAPAEPAPSPACLDAERAILVVLLGFAVSGFSAMILEVAWTRALVQVFGNSTYAFTTMLAAFLIGLALGAAVAGRLIDRARYPFFAFATLELAIGIWSAVATPLIEWLPHVFLHAYQRFQGAFGPLQLTQFVVCCLLMLPTTMALGAVFPVVSKIFSSRAGGAGRSVGIPYAANTLGTVLGALLAGFLFLPRLGVESSLVLASALYLLVWLAVLLTSRETVLRPLPLAALGGLGVIVCARLALAPLDPQVMTAGVYVYPEYFLGAIKGKVSMEAVMRTKDVLYYREGYSASIAVFRLPDGALSLQTNGKTDASTADLATQRALAHLPMLLSPQAKEVLVVGLASGCTVGSTSLYPVERVDCVEIEPAMLEAARFFLPWNHNCLADPRLHLLLQDARNYVLMSNRQYDMITAEPTNPWIAGVNNLFTREYYRQCRARLRPGGIMCQWLPAYNFTAQELRTALATFAAVFPHVTLWSFPRLRTDLFALGSDQPLDLDPAALAEVMAKINPEEFESMGTPDLWTFLGGLLHDEAAVQAFCAGAPLNTDEHPRLEYSTPLHLHRRSAQDPALEAAYAAGEKSRLAVAPDRAQALLSRLGVRLAESVRVQAADFRPHHAYPHRHDRQRRDLAELSLQMETPLGPATLRVAPLPPEQWPESLARLWPAALSSAGWQVSATSEVMRTHRQMPGDTLALLWEIPASAQAISRLALLQNLVIPSPVPDLPSQRTGG